MRFIVLAAMLALLGSAAHAQTPVALDMATVSMTPAGVARMVTDTICVTDGNDLVCDRGAYVLPGGLISTTNISTSALTVNGVAITGSGGAASPTNVPAFSVHRNGVDQTVANGSFTKLNFTTEIFDTYNNFDTGTSRFTPTVPGKYLIILSAYCNGTICYTGIYKNGTLRAQSPPVATGTAASAVFDMNGSTDYIEGMVYNSGGTNVNGSAVATNMSGSLLASGNGLISGSTALGDRITSGTASGVVAMEGGTVSFTTGGTSGTAYLDTVGRFIGPGVSTTGAISATSIYAGAALQLASPTAVTACNSGSAGTIRYNSPTTTLELCTGSGWQPMGVGIPAGTISAFASTTCPTGWSEYTAARGRFLRGIDNGAGNDPDGTRAPGATQADALQNITGGFKLGGSFGGLDTMSGAFAIANTPTGYPNSTNPDNPGVGAASFDASRVARTSLETRPKNVAVTYCQFNGTSNGWNNPLSGGSTVAAGSTGQLQYNTGNAFDASAGLTWTNSASLLTVAGRISATNISVTALTVNGVAITGGGGVSRLASMTDVTTTGVVSGSVLAFNAATSSWTALPIQQVMSTTTMVQGWPDAIICTTGGSTYRNMMLYSDDGTYVSYSLSGSNAYVITYTKATKAYYTHSGAASYDCVTSAFDINQLYSMGRAFNFIGTANTSTSTALGDRITSGTASGVVAMAGGTVSFTTGGTSGTAYLDTVGRFIGPGVSTTGAISATSIYAGSALQLASPTAVTACNSTAAGTIRYNSPTTTLELCTGSGWQPMGVGIPAGTISAFASTTCPVGWSEYTAARGRFLRGIDNGAGNDPAGTRAPGATQADAFQGHAHTYNRPTLYDETGGTLSSQLARIPLTATSSGPVSDGTNGTPRMSSETRPKNVAVTYCQFNGTSNGWNNPLSGGSTVAAGSTGQLQYNTGNAFDASAGLTWTNASSLLGVAGTVSTTSITVGGLTLQQIMASATTAQGDRITSGTSAVVVNSATGIVSITQLGAVASYVHPSLGYVGPGVSATGTVSSSKVATNDVKLSQVGGQCSQTEDYGRFFRNPTTGRFQLCMPRP